MQYNFLFTIEKGNSEKMTFLQLVKTGGKEILEAKAIIQPVSGPPMHVHFRQEEKITVV